MTRIARTTAGRGRLRLTLAAAAVLTAFTLGIGGAAAARRNPPATPAARPRPVGPGRPAAG
jgi:hypothetical protein